MEKGITMSIENSDLEATRRAEEEARRQAEQAAKDARNAVDVSRKDFQEKYPDFSLEVGEQGRSLYTETQAPDRPTSSEVRIPNDSPSSEEAYGFAAMGARFVEMLKEGAKEFKEAVQEWSQERAERKEMENKAGEIAEEKTKEWRDWIRQDDDTAEGREFEKIVDQHKKYEYEQALENLKDAKEKEVPKSLEQERNERDEQERDQNAEEERERENEQKKIELEREEINNREQAIKEWAAEQERLRLKNR